MSDTFAQLVQQLEHADHNMRSQAVLAIGKLDNPQKYLLLIEKLCTETDIFVVEDITWALVGHKDEALPLLTAQLHHTDAIVRQRVVHTLGKMGDAHATEALIPILGDANADVVVKCIFVLGQIGDTRAIPALVGLLGHDNVDIEAMLMQVLAGFGASALPYLIGALSHDHWKAREQVVCILGTIGTQEVHHLLIRALQDPHWMVRFEAINALMAYDDSQTKTHLSALQQDPDSRVRALVNQALK